MLRDRLHRAGLKGVAAILLEVLEPLSPFGAQVLWIAQPTLGLWIDRDRIANWAVFLEDGENLARLREELLTEDQHG